MKSLPFSGNSVIIMADITIDISLSFKFRDPGTYIIAREIVISSHISILSFNTALY